MKVGYLQIERPQADQYGLTRYGRLLAVEARTRSDLEVIEANVTLTTDRQCDQSLLTAAARQLSKADIVHLQYSRFLWSRGWTQLYHLWTFTRHCSRPLVVTLHDLYPHFYPRDGLFKVLRQAYLEQTVAYASRLQKGRNGLGVGKNYLADRWALRWLSRRARLILVCTAEEKDRSKQLLDQNKVVIVPHFVEMRSSKVNRAEVRAGLGLNGFKWIAVQGFIYPGKGHALVIQAMPELPPEVKVIFIGGPAAGNEAYLQQLLALAERGGVRDRLQVTGYLSEEKLEQYLFACDLAVCPFAMLSASSSLSTWISVARPILAADLPQIAEYQQLEPGAIKTFSPYTPAALADMIRKMLLTSSEAEDEAVARLRNKLSMPTIFDQHLKQYLACL